MRLAIVHRATGKVVNVIEGTEDYSVDSDHILIPSDVAGPEDTYDAAAETFTPVPTPDPENPANFTLRQRYDAADTDSESLSVIAKHLELED